MGGYLLALQARLCALIYMKNICGINRSSRFFCAFFLLLVLAISGCTGGGGGDALPAVENTTSRGDIENYFPLSSGAKWLYQASIEKGTQQNENYRYLLDVTDYKNEGGKETAKIRQMELDLSRPTVEFTYEKDISSIRIVKRGADPSANGFYFMSYDALYFPVDSVLSRPVFYGTEIGKWNYVSLTGYVREMRLPGDEFFPYEINSFSDKKSDIYQSNGKNSLRVGKDLDGDGVNESFDYSESSELIGHENVTVVCGAFRNALVVEKKLSINVFLSKSKAKISRNITTRLWYASQIGLIKKVEQHTLTGGLVDDSAKVTHELTAYSVGDLRAGVLKVDTLVPNLDSPSSDDTSLTSPAVAVDRHGNYVVAQTTIDRTYNDNIKYAISLSSLSSTGSILEQKVISSLGRAMVRPSLASNGDGFMLAATGGVIDISLKLINRDVQGRLSFISAVIPYSYDGWPPSNPVVGFDGNNYIVVYSKQWGHIDPRNGLYFATVTPTGVVTEYDQPIYISEKSIGSHAMTCAAGHCLLVWSEESGEYTTDYISRSDIYGLLIKQRAVGDVFAITTASEEQSLPAVSFDGNNYFVVWRDHRNYPDQAYYLNPTVSDIYGARVHPVSGLLDGPPRSGGFIVNKSKTPKVAPSVAFDGRNYLVAWLTVAPSAGVFGTWMSIAGTSVLSGLPIDGFPISGPPSESQFYSGVVAASNQRGSLLFWLDNSAPAKSMVMAPIFMPVP